MVIIEEPYEFLFQVVSKSDFMDGLWYLDLGASSHMIGRRNLFFNLDESSIGIVKFGDGSRIMIQVTWIYSPQFPRWKISDPYQSSLHSTASRKYVESWAIR